MRQRRVSQLLDRRAPDIRCFEFVAIAFGGVPRLLRLAVQLRVVDRLAGATPELDRECQVGLVVVTFGVATDERDAARIRPRVYSGAHRVDWALSSRINARCPASGRLGAPGILDRGIGHRPSRAQHGGEAMLADRSNG